MRSSAFGAVPLKHPISSEPDHAGSSLDVEIEYLLALLGFPTFPTGASLALWSSKLHLTCYIRN